MIYYSIVLRLEEKALRKQNQEAQGAGLSESRCIGTSFPASSEQNLFLAFLFSAAASFVYFSQLKEKSKSLSGLKTSN